ncbi:sigma-70 family RNA polymerase sigma factor [Microvirga tunisiensis]|uniref:Sigma-70 family RNA polymerase sigma factor n=1 Tax=Microvirga tunisiensis TaxID=2108360 RepID=A0A5N7MFE7_9HYPH|nr:sigma-70 family RNA polymerase sigma factor [Microvirga tunisiensis]MPR07455.1 sigma-70 family RNA polymerase sigma factor [Microvirga tunisiensis]MPR25721.1 sigma-70 family RNA polymerase sigma factor [Microvirga tunisiensis]
MDEIASLLEPQIPGLRRYAWALLRDCEAADDLVQDTLERAISRWNQRRDGDLRAWLFAIQRNLFINGLRRRKARGTRVGEEALNDVPAPGMSPESHAGLHDVLKGLDALPEEQRSILLLVGVEDLSYEQAAQVLDIPLGTVMSRLSRARARLRDFMETGRGAVLRRVK